MRRLLGPGEDLDAEAGVDEGSEGTRPNGARGNTTTPLPSYLTEEHKEAWVSRYSRPGAMAASLNYYKAILRGVQAADEAGLTDADRTLRVPVLAIGATQDFVATPDRVATTIEHYAAAGYRVEMVDAGHWMMLEQKENVSRILLEFVSGKK